MNVDRFISHRGANTDFVENTIESFEIARAYGFNWFEIDVQMSRDGELFLFHDRTPKRLSSSEFDVTNMSMRELKLLDIAHPVLKVLGKIPTLKEYLDWANQNGIYTNLEFKITNPCFKYKTDIVFKTLELLKAYPDLKDNILLSSFSNVVMNTLENDASYRKGKLFYTTNWEKDFNYIDTKVYRYFVENNYLAIIINYGCLNKERVSYLKKKFGRVFVYSVYTDYEVKKLLEWGVDAMFVDKKEYLDLDYK